MHDLEDNVLCNFRFGFVEYMTFTGSRQAWGQSKTNMTSLWRAKPVGALCCVRKHQRLDSPSAIYKEELIQQAYDRILKGKISALYCQRLCYIYFFY